MQCSSVAGWGILKAPKTVTGELPVIEDVWSMDEGGNVSGKKEMM